jgi:hypothetical protein
MDTRITQKLGSLAIGAALLVTMAPGIASAQDKPSYASSDEDTIHGRIVSVDDPFHISVRDGRGFVDHVTLHQGTIINPTGLTLHPGMTVTVLGVNAGATLAANEIDTPYNYAPAYAYAYPAYPVFYGAYPYGYPAVNLDFGFGGRFGGYGRFR